jgi:hypothetical protein
VLLPLTPLLLRPESIPFSALLALSAVRFSVYRWNSPNSWTGENCEKRFFMNTPGEELPMKWRFGMTAPVNSISRAAGHSLRKITIFIKAFS